MEGGKQAMKATEKEKQEQGKKGFHKFKTKDQIEKIKKSWILG